MKYAEIITKGEIMTIEHRETFWKEKHYQTVEKGNGWRIERPTEIKPLDDLLTDFFKKRRYKWE